MLVAVDGRLLGAIGVRDALRDESRSVIAELKQAGVRSFALLTGDRPQAARTVADALGVFDEVQSGLFPADKARWIGEQKRRGRRVAMVGDGINDAPALAAADVGIALGGVGSDIAAEAGSLVLMGDPLKPLPGLFRLSQALVRNIRQSILFFAFGMNAIGMLLCGVGILSPVGGAVFHEFASLAVMLNATRLLWFERLQSSTAAETGSSLRIAEWLTEALSPSRWIFRLIENRAVVLGVLVPAIVFVWLLSGIVCIRDNERAFVTRFGRAEADLPAGVHWRLPVPFERIYREPADKLRTVQIGFRGSDARPASDPAAVGEPIEWTSEHNEAGFESRPDESLVLTGDEVLVEMTAEVQWRVANLRQYLFDAARPVDTLRTVAESVLREMASRQTLDGILTERRQAIEDDCLSRLRGRIKPLGLGIEVTELTLLDVHPPRPAVSAYRDVADALEEKEERINEAEAYYAGRLLRAAGERAVLMLSDAAADSQTAVRSIDGRRRLELDADRRSLGGIGSRVADDEAVLSGEAASVLLGARAQATQTTQAAGGQADRFNELLGVPVAAAADWPTPLLAGGHRLALRAGSDDR